MGVITLFFLFFFLSETLARPQSIVDSFHEGQPNVYLGPIKFCYHQIHVFWPIDRVLSPCLASDILNWETQFAIDNWFLYYFIISLLS